jgi:hypothetical protein
MDLSGGRTSCPPARKRADFPKRFSGDMSSLRPLADRMSALWLRRRARPFVSLGGNKKGEPRGSPKFLVGMRGLEPPRCHHHRLLRPARLPVPPHPRGVRIYEPDQGVSRRRSSKLYSLFTGVRVPTLVGLFFVERTRLKSVL